MTIHQAIATATSRRALFAGIATMGGALAIPAAAAADPDAELIALDAERERAMADLDRAEDIEEAASERYFAAAPARPDSIMYRADDWRAVSVHRRSLGYYTEGDVRQIEQDLGTHRDRALANGSTPSPMARCAEILRGLRAYAVQASVVRSACGLEAAEARSAAVGEALTGIERRMLATPARTSRGLRIKARLAQSYWVCPPADEADYGDEMLRSLLDDLMTAGAE